MKQKGKTELPQVNIYPNPSSESISIQIPEKGKWSVIFTDISGKVVMI